VSGQPVGLLRVLGLSLVVGGGLLVVGYTAATLREMQLIAADFGELATGAGREAMLPRLIVVNVVGVLTILGGTVLLYTGRRRGTLRPTGAPEVREIRKAEIAEASELVGEAYRALLGEDLGEEYAAVITDVADRAERATVLVAVEQGRLVGCVTFVVGPGPYVEWPEDPEKPAAGIRMLAVPPHLQGRGIGAQLVRACVDRARAAGHARVLLHSTEPMRAAQRLYEREGFSRHPEIDREISPGLVLLGYELIL
jgi:GNAT superfamily N-acetyltransferase